LTLLELTDFSGVTIDPDTAQIIQRFGKQRLNEGCTDATRSAEQMQVNGHGCCASLAR
jgi:hypothetical protein